MGIDSANALDPLEKLHKRIVQILTNSPDRPRAHTTPLFRKLNLLKLKDICTIEIAKNVLPSNKPCYLLK